MTAPTSFLEGLQALNKPFRCKAGAAFDKHLTAEEVTEFEMAGRAPLANLAELRRYFNQYAAEQVGKDSFNRHMRQECPCE